jgi:hypothetical protein
MKMMKIGSIVDASVAILTSKILLLERIVPVALNHYLMATEMKIWIVTTTETEIVTGVIAIESMIETAIMTVTANESAGATKIGIEEEMNHRTDTEAKC